MPDPAGKLGTTSALPPILQKVKKNFRFAFGHSMNSNDEEKVLLATKQTSIADDELEDSCASAASSSQDDEIIAEQPVKRNKLLDIPLKGRFVLYQLLREDIVGVNTGSVEIRFPPGNEYGLASISVYPHGLRGLLRSEAHGDVTGLGKQCNTIRTNVLPRCRNAVIRVFRDIFHGTTDQKRAARLLLGMLRIEFNLEALNYAGAHKKLGDFLLTMDAQEMLLPGQDEGAESRRRNASFKLLDHLCISVRTVRVELVLESLIHAVRELHGMISTLGTADTLEARRTQRIPKKDYPRLLRVFKDLGQRASNARVYGYGVDIFGDYCRQYMTELIDTVFLRHTFFTNEANAERQGFSLVDMKKMEDEAELSYRPVETDWEAGDAQAEDECDEEVGGRGRKINEDDDDDVVWAGLVENIEPSCEDALKALTRGAYFARRNMLEKLHIEKYQTMQGYRFFDRYLSIERASQPPYSELQTPDDMDEVRAEMRERVAFQGKTEYCVDISKLLSMEQPAECGSRLSSMSGDSDEVQALSEIVKNLGYSRHCMSRFYMAGDKSTPREKRATINLKKRIAGDPYFMDGVTNLDTQEEWWKDDERMRSLIEKVRMKSM